MKKTVLVLIIMAGALLCTAASGSFPIIAIKNAHIIPVSGEEIPSGIILIREGKIEAVGPDIPIPPDAEVIDAQGLYAYPGMIDPYAYLGLLEISNLSATADQNELGEINSQIRAVEALRPDSMHIPLARANGITAAQIIPGGAFIGGMAGIIRLDGRIMPDMVINPASMLNVNIAGGFYMMGSMPKIMKTEDKIKEFKELLQNTRLYMNRKAAAQKNVSREWPEFDEALEFMIPVVEGKVRVLVAVLSEKDIKDVLKMIEEEKLNAVLFGCSEGWKAAEEIKASGVPVILGNVLSSRGDFEDGYDCYYRNPAKLHEAGIKFAFSSDKFLPPLSIDLPYHASKAAAFGLDPAEALKAVTLNTAEILGVSDIMGSLDPGKAANIVLSDGDILDRRTNIKYVFIDGRKMDLSNRYLELLEKHRTDRK